MTKAGHDFIMAKGPEMDDTAETELLLAELQQRIENAMTAMVTRRTAARKRAWDRRFSVAALCATGASIALGASGGVAGLLRGSTAGAVAAAPFALLTMGLSIPVGAAVAGGAGGVAGIWIGSGLGFLGGGAAGYKVMS